MPDLIAHGIQFRAIVADDEALLSAIYASTRADEMALVTAWTDADKAAFLEGQFKAQHVHYQHNYPNADFQVILFKGKAAGRLYLDRRATEIRIVDITLLPEFRGLGLGELILRSVLDEATGRNHSVSIHVERYNKALSLYHRLGFKMVDDAHPVYLFMEWHPAPR